MGAEATATQFAPAERAAEAEIRRQSRLLEGTAHLPMLFDAVSAIVLIVNRERQIVFANEACTQLLGYEKPESLYGLRPGEALECRHADEMAAGCGTAEACKTCGAVQAVLESQAGRRDVRECRITRQKDCEALDLLVWATPLSLNGEAFTIIAFTDISHEKRRRALERIFFHDILNAVGAVQGMAAVLRDVGPQDMEEFRERIYQMARHLGKEIEWHRALTQAENNELDPNRSMLSAGDLLAELAEAYMNHAVANHRQVVVDERSQNVSFLSDYVLVRRVLGNMVKNALEASEPRQTVTLRCEKAGEDVRFSVHNPAFMPREIQLQVFQRSFTTKGTGRGLGTYSMKLLSERYLRGKVSFTTSPEAGTTFVAQYPVLWDE